MFTARVMKSFVPVAKLGLFRVIICRNQLVYGMIARSIETTGAALGLDKVGLNCPKVHRNMTYGTKLIMVKFIA